MRVQGAVVSVALCLLAGCGQSPSRIDVLGQERVRLANARADEWEAIAASQSKEEAKEAAGRMSKIVAEIKALEEKVRKLSEADREAMDKKYAAELAKAGERFKTAQAKIIEKAKSEDKAKGEEKPKSADK